MSILTNQIYSIPINQLLNEVAGRRFYVNRKEAMHYCSPASGGWGVVRVACMIPEVEVVFVIPIGCGRHGAIASFANETVDKLNFFLVDEVGIVIGEHLEGLESALSILVEEKKPKGLLICSTCMDDLLGTDYKSLERELEDKLGVIIRHGKMNPILSETKKAPELMIQQNIYEFLNEPTQQDDGINIIGSFVSVEKNSELEVLLLEAGVTEVRHIASCESFETYQKLASSSANILVNSLGIVATTYLEKTKKQKKILAYQGFTLDEIDKGYQLIEEHCQRKLNTQTLREQYIKTLEENKIYQGKTVAIGATVNARAFELAKFLSELGFEVRYIISKSVSDIDKPCVRWLEEHAPKAVVLPNLEPSIGMAEDIIDSVDYCFGLDAAWLFKTRYLVDLSFNKLLYGYTGGIELMKQISQCQVFEGNIVEEIYKANFVV